MARALFSSILDDEESQQRFCYAADIQGEIVQSPIGRIEAARFGIIDVSVSDASRSANLAIIRRSRMVEVVMYRVLT